MYVIAAVAMACSVLLTVSDVILRLFKRPILGTYELVGMLAAVTVGFALPETSLTRGHVIMDMFTGRLSPALWKGFHILTTNNGHTLFCHYLLESLGHGGRLHGLGRGIHHLTDSALPSRLCSSGMLSSAVPGSLCGDAREKGRATMSFAAIGLLIITLVFVLFFLGVEIGFAMGIAGFIGFAWIRGWDAASTLVANDMYSVLSSYGFSVIGMFVLMGQIAASGGVAKKLYDSAYKFLGHIPGGLAMGTVAACTAFKAICGNAPATAATFATIADTRNGQVTGTIKDSLAGLWQQWAHWV